MTPQPPESVHIAVVDRLLAEFPQTPAAAVTDAVRRAEEQFSEARISSYLPILVERAARRLLTSALPAAAPQHGLASATR